MEATSKGSIYNTKPLASSAAAYIGREIPYESLQYPAIIQNPLRKLYSPDGTKRVQSSCEVSIYVYNSGIIVQEKRGGHVYWFPIQNLYCSAAVIPHRGSHGNLTFIHLNDSESKKKKPIFAMVVRQSEQGTADSKRVVMCHAFLVDNRTSAQSLVESTQMAYQNKSGWNHPMNDKQFLNIKITHTLHMLSKNEEERLEELKDITISRDQQLAQLPLPSGRQNVGSPSSRAPGSPRSVSFHEPPQRRQVTLVHQQSQKPSASVRVKANGLRTHSSGFHTPDYQSPRPATSSIRRVPQPAIQYNGFSSDITTNGTAQVIQQHPPSLNGYPTSRSSSNNSSAQAMFDGLHVIDGKRRSKPKHRSSRLHQPSTPRNHRVLASSEPQELVNGFRPSYEEHNSQMNGAVPNGHSSQRSTRRISHPGLRNWEDMLDSADVNGNTHQVDIGNIEGQSSDTQNKQPDKSKLEVKSSVDGQSTKSDSSSYSITQLNGHGPHVNGFSADHEFADHQL